MLLYVQCPHCEFPAIISPAVPGRIHRCRQCNDYFVLRLYPQTEQQPPSASSEIRPPLKKAV